MKSSKKIAIFLFVAASLWMFSGLVTSDTSNNVPLLKEEKSLQKVRIERKVAVKREKTVSIYGVTEAMRQVDIKAEVEGKITLKAVSEGDILKKGDLILQIEERDRKARLAEAIALRKQREIEFKAAKQLSLRGFQAETKLAAAKAALEASRANAIQAQINFDNTIITAPFDGILERLAVDVGDLVGPNIMIGQGSFNDGNSVATIIDRDPFLIIGQVSERVVKDIKIGLTGYIDLLTGESVEGKIRFIGTLADPLTRTFRIELEVPNKDGEIISGVTASITIHVKTEMAHHISPSILTLNAEGELGIKALVDTSSPELQRNSRVISSKNTEIPLESARANSGNDGTITGKVTFYKVEIFDNDEDGIWITGIPETLNFITVGQSFVAEGEIAIGVNAEKIAEK